MTVITFTREQRIAHLAMDAAEHRLCGIGVLSRHRLIQALIDDTAEADRLINSVTEQIENNPVYLVTIAILDNPVALAAASATDLADKLTTFLALYKELPCKVEIDLEQGDGHVYPQTGGTIAISVREIAPTYTVTWMTKWGQRTRLDITRSLFDRRLGKNLGHRAALPSGDDHRVWDIAVHDKHNSDVTNTFEVLTGVRKPADRVPFAEAHIALGSDTETVIRHLDGLVQRHPHLWESSAHGLYRVYRYKAAGYSGSMIEIWSQDRGLVALFISPLAKAVHRINCIALSLPLTTTPDAVDRLIRVARGFADSPRRVLREWAAGEVTA
ncbi:hypothetical protein [Nonomuraea lactucae]|uniref:hypothetical protein n=1 Tax=Nonomuraea lactucae TaxID=2249762 RepID=UPI000DE34722|nr:hypothetical protein [Nonomuraea lactucae]